MDISIFFDFFKRKPNRSPAHQEDWGYDAESTSQTH